MTIYFSPNKPHLKPLQVSEADSKEKNLMQLLLAVNIPVASSCNGDGICSKCRVQVISGKENLNSESELETRTKIKNKVIKDERLSCQVFLNGDVTIDTLYW